MNIVTIVTAVCGAIVLLNVLTGIRRGPFRSTVRLITLAISAVGAVFATHLLSDYASKGMMALLKNTVLKDPSISALLAEDPSAVEALIAISRMLAAPITFLLAFFVLKFITLIIYKIFFFLPKGGFLFRFAGGAVVGAVVGVLGVAVLLVPVFGYVEVAADCASVLATETAEMEGMPSTEHVLALDADEPTTPDSTTPPDGTVPDSTTPPAGAEGATKPAFDVVKLAQTLDNISKKYLKPMLDTPLVGQLYDSVGRRVFDNLTTTEWNGTELKLSGEMQALVLTASDVGTLTGSELNQFGEKETAAVGRLAGHLSDSATLSSVLSFFLHSASETWLKGDTFMGIECPKSDPNANALIRGFLTVFSTSNPQNLKDDLGTLTGFFGLMVDYDLFKLMGNESTSNDFLNNLAKGGFLEEAKGLLDSNARMKPVKDAIVDTAMRVLVAELGDPEQYRETCGALMDDVAGILRDAPRNPDGTYDATAMGDQIESALATSGITGVDRTAIDLVTEGFSENFSDMDLTAKNNDEIVDEVINYLSDVEKIENLVSSAIDGGAALPEGGTEGGGISLPGGITIPDGVELPGGIKIPS